MEKLNVEITMQKVQKYRFWLHTSRHNFEQVTYIVEPYPVDESGMHLWVEDWASQYYGWYDSITFGFDRVGEPYIQKRITIPISEMRKLLELTDDEQLSFVSYDKECVTFTTGVNEPDENPTET